MGVNERIDNLEKEHRYLKNLLREIKEDLEDIKRQNGGNQPKSKLKVYSSVKMDNGAIKKIPANDTIREIKTQVKKQSSIETSQVSKIIKSNGYDLSRRAILNKMETIASVFDDVEYIKPNKRGKSSRLASN